MHKKICRDIEYQQSFAKDQRKEQKRVKKKRGKEGRLEGRNRERKKQMRRTEQEIVGYDQSETHNYLITCVLFCFSANSQMLPKSSLK